jgi:hypothetical protein
MLPELHQVSHGRGTPVADPVSGFKLSLTPASQLYALDLPILM